MAEPCERGNEEFREIQTMSLPAERLVLVSHEWLRSIELAHLFQICGLRLGSRAAHVKSSSLIVHLCLSTLALMRLDAEE
jgi:hypothetical protein